MDVGPGGDSHQHAFLFADPTGHGEGFIVAHRDDLVDDVEVQIVRNKAGARSLNFVRAGFDRLTRASLGDDGGILGLHRDGLEGFFPSFDHFGHSGYGAPGTDR